MHKIVVSANRFGLGFSRDTFNLCTSHVHAFFMHTFFHFFLFLNLCCVSLCSLSLSLGKTALWHPNRENLLRLGTLFKDFSKNFQARGVHLERQVILLDFADTPLPEVIQTQDWESMIERPTRCPVMVI